MIGGSTVLDRESEAMLFDNPEDASILSEYNTQAKPGKESGNQSIISGRQSVRTTRTKQTFQQGPGSVRSNTSTSSRVTAVRRKIGRVTELSEVDEMGLPVDGYNYSQHFSAGGGGVFIDKNGRISRNGSVATRSIYNGGNNVSDSDSIFDSSASAMMRLADGRSVVSSASVLDDLAEGIYTTHEAANRVGLPLSVLPTVPEQEAETDLGKRLEAVVLRVESMPADLKKAMEVIEEVDIDEHDEEDDDDKNSKNVPNSNIHGNTNSSSSENPSDGNDKLPGYVPLSAIKDIDIEELQDDFVLRALGELPISDDYDANAVSDEVDNTVYADDVKKFDFDAHVKSLLARAEGQMIDMDNLDENGDNDDDIEFEFDEDDDENDHEGDDKDYPDNEPYIPGKQRIGSELLQAMLEQYDDENYGELDDNDPRLRQDGFRGVFSNPTDTKGTKSSSKKAAGIVKPKKEENDEEYQEGDEDYGDSDDYDENDDDEDDEHYIDIGDEEEEEENENDNKLIPISADMLLKSAIEDFDRHKEEGMLLSAYQVAMLGRESDNPKISNKKLQHTQNDDQDNADEEYDENDDYDSINDDEEEDDNIPHPSEHTISAILSQSEVTNNTKIPPPTIPSNPKSAAFSVKIGLLKNKQPSATTSTDPSAPILERPPSPVSSSAAQVAAKLTSTLNKFNEYSKLSEKALEKKLNPSSNTGDNVEQERIIPFGWAEGDIQDDALDYFPPEWTEYKEKPKWDVETVISTFTTTEHHPKRLDDGVSISSSRLHQGPKKLEVRSNASVTQSSISMPLTNKDSMLSEDGRIEKGNAMTVGAGVNGVVRLSKKTGLPMGRTKKLIDATIPEENTTTNDEDNDDQAPVQANEADNHNDDSNEEDEDNDEEETTVSLVRRKGETAEEKRQRKALVKAERREKRIQKKNTKLAYKEETIRQKTHVHKLDSLGRGTIII